MARSDGRRTEIQHNIGKLLEFYYLAVKMQGCDVTQIQHLHINPYLVFLEHRRRPSLLMGTSLETSSKYVLESEFYTSARVLTRRV
jgi:hypothetical protein